MKGSLINKLKILVIAVVLIVVAGLAVLGFVGFNNTVDFKKSYEVSVSLTQDVNGSFEIAKSSAEKYFAEKKQQPVEYALQNGDDGFVFKFESLSGISKTELEAYINKALEGKKAVASVEVDEVVPEIYLQVGKLAIALGVALVACFIYLLITHKGASSLSAMFSSVIAGLTFIALVALTRVPAYPFVSALLLGSVALSLMLSAGMLNRFKEEIKLNEKASSDEIAGKVIKDSLLRYVFIFVALLAVSAVFVAVGSVPLKFIGLQLVVATFAGISCSLLFTPIFWSLIKGKKSAK